MDQCNIKTWDSPTVHTFYTESKKPSKHTNPIGIVTTVGLAILGIEETIFKTVIKLVIDLLA